MRVLLAGASGTIGRATAQALVKQGHDVLCALRPGSSVAIAGPTKVTCQLTQAGSLTHALGGQRIDAVISCMATRTGAIADAWTVEHDAQVHLLREAGEAGAQHFVLLSAICVQKPELAFQKAKAKFEQRLRTSGLNWSIVRPTAFFKSLSGQVARVQAGKPYHVFGDGTQTACKPISDRDLAQFLVLCLTDADKRNALLPIGGPGPAITPLEQGRRLFEILGKPPKIRRVPYLMMDGIVATTNLLGRISTRAAEKAEFARTGRYYATESMLVWNETTGRYDASATPVFGSDLLWDHYRDLIEGRTSADLGAHAYFSRK